MSLLRSAAFLFCLLSLPARANLGENVKQLVARYGTPVNYAEANPKFPFGTILFSASGINLAVFVLGDKEVGARVSKVDKSAFSDQEREAIMNADLGGSQWVSTPSNDPTTLQWIRADHANVMYDKQKNMLIFTSDDMAKALQAAQSAPAATNAPTSQVAPDLPAPVAPAPQTK